jgi:CPA1 family monovalent cation:H+ antiporter
VTGSFLVAVLAGLVALALIAKRLRVPYPVVFVIGGLVVALLPHVPAIELRPDVVFLLFLPPLIFGDGWTTDYRSFKRYARPIFMLAIGLVAFTSVVVAYVAHWVIGVPLAVGFVLGAVLSPTDAVAADAIAEEVGLPKRLMTLIGGESLVNDATALVIYAFAITAVATGSFAPLAAAVQFVYVVVAGVGIGLAGAWLIARFTIAVRAAGLTDPVIAVSISLVTPFALYVPADAVHASGVLAAMSGGIYLSRKSSRIFDAESRLAAGGVWNLLFFVFNGAAFVLIGMQLRTIVRGLAPYALGTLIGWSLLIAAVVVIVRYVWMIPATYIPRMLFPGIRRREGPDPPLTWVLVLSTAGMRGIVSLAAALAIPETIAPGVAFPGRDLILFVTFVVILVTLVGEGLALPLLIRRWDVVDSEDEGPLVAAARVRVADAARERLRALEPTFDSPAAWEVAGRLNAGYEQRSAHFAAHAHGSATDDDAQLHAIERRLRLETHAAERAALQAMRRTGEISDGAYRQLEWELDLADSQLE